MPIDFQEDAAPHPAVAAAPHALDFQEDAPAPSEPGLGTKILRFLSEPPATDPQYAAFLKRASPPDAITNDSPDWKAAIGSAAKSMPGLIPSMGGDDRIAKFEQEHPGIALALGFAGPGGMKKAGAAARVAQDGGIMAKLRAFVGRAATDVGDQSARAADATASSAIGTLGKKTAGGSSDLTLLQKLVDQGVSPETEAAIREALNGPGAAALRESLAQHGLERFPGHLGEIENARGLVEATQADAAAARTPEAIQSFAKQKIKDTAKTIATRYVLPSAVSAGVGTVLGGDENGAAGGAIGGVLGLGFRPGLRAISRAATSPSVRLMGGTAAVSVAEKVAKLPLAQLGRFAAPIQNALKRGPNALAAIHYKLSEDPEYQAITRKAAEQQAGNDGAAQ